MLFLYRRFYMCSSWGAIYAYNFSEYEATALASFYRYMNMAFLPIWLFMIFGFLDILKGQEKKQFIFLLAIMMLIPAKPVYGMITREKVRLSREMRDRYSSIDALFEEKCDGDDRIYVITQEDTGYDSMVCKFLARPNYASSSCGFSFGTQPYYENDLYTRDVSVDEFKQELAENYDYLFICRLNSYFTDTYSELFEDEIIERQLYVVDKEKGILSLCR